MIAIYARQSVDKKDSLSIDTQVDICKAQCPSEFKKYIDKGYTGANTNRPEFKKLLKDIENGTISKIIAYRLDRISRSIIDFANFLKLLEDNNVSFTSATENIDTSTPIGRAMVNIIMTFAQLERETIAERIKDSYYARCKKGLFGGGNAPYGMKSIRTTINGKKASILTVDEETINVVKEIFELYSTPATSLADVQRALNKKGCKTAEGKNWDSYKVSRILNNPTYVKANADIYNYYSSKCIMANEIEEFTGQNGCILFGKRDSNTRKYADLENHVLAIGKHKGVIDSSIFLYCQHKLSKNRQIKNHGQGTHTWLSGIIKCAHCGYAMTVKTFNGKHGVYKYFVCSGKYSLRVCDYKHPTYHVEKIEELVEEKLFKTIQSMDCSLEIKESSKENDYKLTIMDIESKIGNLLDQLQESSEVTAGYINRRIEELDRKLNETKEELSQLAVEKIERFNFTIDDWKIFDVPKKKNAARSLIEQVNLIENKVDIVQKI